MDRISIFNLVLACHLAVMSWIDLRRYVIPNILNLSLALCGLVMAVIVLEKNLAGVLL